MRRLKRRLRILCIDLRIAWLMVRFGKYWVKVRLHCLLTGITVAEYRRRQRLRRLAGHAPDLGCGC